MDISDAPAADLPADPYILPCNETFETEEGRRVPVPSGWTPFPANPPPEKVGTRPQVRASRPASSRLAAHARVRAAPRRRQLTSDLHVACFDKDAARVERLLAEGSDVGNKYRVNRVDLESSPLAMLVRRPANSAQEAVNIATIARALLEAGANVEGHENEDSPLVLACIAGGGKFSKAQTVQVIVDAGANLRSRCKSLQMTALHWAITCGFPDVVEILLRAGASATTISGKTPRETPLQMADKRLHQVGLGTYTSRHTFDEAEKAAIRDDVAAIRHMVARASEDRAEQKAHKKANKKSAGAA